MNILQGIIRKLLGRGRKRHFYHYGVEPYVRQLKKYFKKHPVKMSAITYGSLFTCAELSQQSFRHYYNNYSQKNKHLTSSINEKTTTTTTTVMKHEPFWTKYDFSSVKRFALWGTPIGVVFHYWYQYLHFKYPLDGLAPGRILYTQIAKMCFMDQIIITPPLLLLFFGSMAALEFWESKNFQASIQETWSYSKAEISKVPKVWIFDCIFWIPVQFLNFRWVPYTWRVLYIGIMTFLWTNILCLFKTLDLNQMLVFKKLGTSKPCENHTTEQLGENDK